MKSTMKSAKNIDMNDLDLCREYGKNLILDKNSTRQERDVGIKLIIHAANKGNLEAKCLLGKFLVDGVLRLPNKNSSEAGMSYIWSAANAGYPYARLLLNQYCQEKYEETIGDVGYDASEVAGQLRDFEGKIIKIKRTGIFTPVDAKLEFSEGKNILLLSANILFEDLDADMEDIDLYHAAVVDGILEWQGHYKVFGGQDIEIKIELSFDSKRYDSIHVIPMTKELRDAMKDFASLLNASAKDKIENMVDSKRSMAAIGLRKWSVHSRKYIFLQLADGNYSDYEEIKHIIKHEFGHILGLGDLYKDIANGYEGVAKGQYSEIDQYHIIDKFYNLVMCDHHGPISNNDVEMVLLAFSENVMQNYQKTEKFGGISNALGKGN